MIPSLICITLHELSHGLVAYRLGDDTAKRAGRLTLNPLRHLDPMGLLMMVVFHFGWAKPVPVNMCRFQEPQAGHGAHGPGRTGQQCADHGGVSVSLRGALSARSAAVLGVYLLQMLQLTAHISLGLAVFNLLPIPPLDGSKVLFSLLPEDKYWQLMRYERYGSIAAVACWWHRAFWAGRSLGGALVYDASVPHGPVGLSTGLFSVLSVRI